MELNKQKDKIQDRAVEKWGYVAKHGTCEMITGMGKTFVALKALYTMPRHQQDTIHLFLAEQKDRLSDLSKDIIKFNEIYNCNVMADYNLQFQCYQTVYRWKNTKLGLVIADEIHDSLTPEYFKFYINNSFDAILGLSAKISNITNYTIKKVPELREIFKKDIINKHDMLGYIAPICFKYDINQGQTEGTSRKLNIFIVQSKLNSENKTVLAGNAKNRFYQSEAAAYAYADKLFNTALNAIPYENEDLYDFEERKNLEIIKASTRRSKVLYDLPTKLTLTRQILANVKGKTVVFGNSLTSLSKITINIISSKNSDKQNQSIRNAFDEDRVKTIASFKKLKQGANLDKVDNCIIMSYYSTELDFIQRIGRLRQNGDKDGNVFVLVTKYTQEEVWLKAMLKNTEEYNIIFCNIEECINMIKDEQK